MPTVITPLSVCYFLSLLLAYYLGKNFPDPNCFKASIDNRPIRLKKIDELTDAEIKKVRAQQAPCHYGNCTAREYKAIEWPDVDDQHPIIWVGGMPRSGTTLMRAILDVHPDVRCGEETRVIPRVMMVRKQIKSVTHMKESAFSQDALSSEGEDAMNEAVKRFILEVIEKHGPISRRLCNKDPFALKFMTELTGWYPNSKFIYMLRDARSVAHSIITRKVTITGYDLTNYTDVIHRWDMAHQQMWQQCQDLGPKICMPVHYEHLILEKEQVLKKIVEFLGLKWFDGLIHHEEHIGSDISLSSLERSTDQVVKATYTTALSSWEGIIPEEDLKNVERVAPLMKVFGYKPEVHVGSYDHFISSKQSKYFKKTFPFRV